MPKQPMMMKEKEMKGMMKKMPKKFVSELIIIIIYLKRFAASL